MNPSGFQRIIPMLITSAFAWAEARSVEIQAVGAKLDPDGTTIA